MALKYKELSPSEKLLREDILDWVLDDDEIMSAVGGFHGKGKRCAVVVWVEDGDIDDGYISDDVAVNDQFDFEPVREAVESYDPDHDVCVVLVRDDKVAVLIGELRKLEDA
jgi:hypothetical protein